MLKIDIIIPVLNEERVLVNSKEYYRWLKTKAHLIFVDGGSQDQTIKIAQEFGEVIVTSPGRAFQKNEASKKSNADFLVFLHVDTILTNVAWDKLSEAVKSNMKVGCFRLKINDQNIIFRLFEFVINFRAKYFRVIDGDMGLIIERHEFEKIGRFDQVKIMEDILFSKKLKKLKGFQLMQGDILASTRVWYQKGFLSVFCIYGQRYFKYWMDQLILMFNCRPVSQ